MPSMNENFPFRADYVAYEVEPHHGDPTIYLIVGDGYPAYQHPLAELSNEPSMNIQPADLLLFQVPDRANRESCPQGVGRLGSIHGHLVPSSIPRTTMGLARNEESDYASGGLCIEGAPAIPKKGLSSC